MTKRPNVMDLDALMRPEMPEPAPVAPIPEPAAKEPEVAPQPEPPSKPTLAEAAEEQPPVAKSKTSPAFRTSVYFHREVHDVLREIAHRERKNISDLINEGLDHVLTSRDHPTTAQLRKSARAS